MKQALLTVFVALAGAFLGALFGAHVAADRAVMRAYDNWLVSRGIDNDYVINAKNEAFRNDLLFLVSVGGAIGGALAGGAIGKAKEKA